MKPCCTDRPAVSVSASLEREATCIARRYVFVDVLPIFRCYGLFYKVEYFLSIFQWDPFDTISLRSTAFFVPLHESYSDSSQDLPEFLWNWCCCVTSAFLPFRQSPQCIIVNFRLINICAFLKKLFILYFFSFYYCFQHGFQYQAIYCAPPSQLPQLHTAAMFKFTRWGKRDIFDWC